MSQQSEASVGLSVLKLADGALDAMTSAITQLHPWYEVEARDLPWRRTRDPYAIWVSEAMLQQTQVATVIPYYERWLQRFPTVSALAEAEEGEVLLCWEGLGYYRRARFLHQAAKVLVSDRQGMVPRETEAFRALPGVGEYTAAAVASIAFDQDQAVLDGNVQRVLARLVCLEGPPTKAPWRRALVALAGRLLPSGRARIHNQALMELGARVCTPRKPRCDVCPLAPACAAERVGDVARYPVKVSRRAIPHRHLAVGVVRDREARLLLYKRPYSGMLAGLWDFPALDVAGLQPVAGALVEVLRQRYGLRVVPQHALPAVNHAYTHLKVTLHPWVLHADPPPLVAAERTDTLRWVGLAGLSEVALPRATHKVLEALSESWADEADEKG
ncbi:MAG: A/G-specific adenine glycosylase [Deltaproteobacteria bacterium]|nr:A/G-specific adenine glycosylase [Deltaproteobacteria bacterium]